MAVGQLDTVNRARLAGARSRVGRAALDVAGRKFALAYVYTARQRAGIVVDAVVGDLQVMAPAMYEDTAAALRAVGDAQPVDARRIAPEAARVRIGARPAGGGRQQCGPGREARQQRRVVLIRAVEVHALGQNRYGGS